MKLKLSYILAMVSILIPIAVYFVLSIYYPDLLTLNGVLSSLERVYSDYGFTILLVAGVAEAVYFVNLFVPGSVAILLGAVLAAKGIISLPAVILLGTFGLMIGYSFNYFAGKYGWFVILSHFKTFKLVEEAEKRIRKQRNFIIFLSGFNPNAASVTSLASGILEMPFLKFLTIFTLMQLFWSTFWGVLFYFFGVVMLQNMYVVVPLAVLIIILIYYAYNRIQKNAQ